MSNNYDNAARRIAETPWVIPVFWLVVVGLALASYSFANDTLTTKFAIDRTSVNWFGGYWGEGYKWAVAIIPQVFSGILAYAVIGLNPDGEQDPDLRRAKIVTRWGLFAILVSLLGTSVWFGYKFYIAPAYATVSPLVILGAVPPPVGLDLNLARAAASEAIFFSVVVDTGMSEFGLSLTVGMLFSLFPYYVAQRGTWRAAIIEDYESKKNAEIARLKADRRRREAEQANRRSQHQPSRNVH